MFQNKLVLPFAFITSILTPLSIAADSNSEKIIGAGAHFSWVVFDGQHKALEKHVGRPISLFGKEQMLGAGCNAGIRIAKSSRPGAETFGLVCCQLSKKELRAKNIRIFSIANEPILILVNRENPVSNLPLKQARQIFSGKIKNWKQVGGLDAPVVVVLRPHCKNRPGHWKTILPRHEDFRKDSVKVRSAIDMVKRVSDFSGAIGHTGSAWKFSDKNQVKAVTISGVRPTAANIKSGKYPFFRTLSAVTNKSPSKDIISLIDYARTSKDFKKIAEKYELSPIHKIKK